MQFEILKLIGAILVMLGCIGLWTIFAAQKRCHYCGEKDSPILYKGRRMCVACYKIYLHQQLKSWYGDDDE